MKNVLFTAVPLVVLIAVFSLATPSQATAIQYPTAGAAEDSPMGAGSIENIAAEAPTSVANPVFPIRECFASRELFQNYERELAALTEAEKLGRREEAEKHLRLITELKSRIAEEEKRCQKIVPSTTTGSITVKDSGPLSNQPVSADNWCGAALGLENKVEYYRKLRGLNDEDLWKIVGEGRRLTEIRTQIEADLNQLLRALERARNQCRDAKIENADEPTVTLRALKPIIPESVEELRRYHEDKKLTIVTETKGTQEQLTALESLREETGELVARLIRAQKEELAVEDLDGLVAKIRVEPRIIKADETEIEATDQELRVKVGTKPLIVRPINDAVAIEENGLRVTVPEVTIEDGQLTVAGKEINLSPQEAVTKSGGKVLGITLQTADETPFYEIEATETRKLLGLIPISISKQVMVEATGGAVKEKLPWYFFLTTKAAN